MKLVNTPQDYPDNPQEVEELQLENMQLKKRLEQEELLHKSLYRQWNELNDRILAKERELGQINSKNLFYKYAFYVVLFAIIPAYYFLSHSKEDTKITPATQVVSTPAPINNQLPINTTDTVPLTSIEPAEKEVIHPDIILQKLPAINKPLSDKPFTTAAIDDKSLTGSARDSIYSQGWDAYYKRSRNPYQRSSQKFEIWLEGWKDGENGAKKLLPRDSLAQ